MWIIRFINWKKISGESSKVKVVFVVGPTASGKSELALQLAERFQGAIVNCDSIQVYQSLNIGSAKPTPEDRARAPHFLFDYVPTGEEITAGTYSRDVFSTLKTLENRFPVTFVVGGTGFYFQAIEKGMYHTGAANPETLRQVEWEVQENPQRVFEYLRRMDPEAAGKISINDHYRLARAVEMIRTHGRSPTEIKRQFEEQREPFPYPLLKLGLRLDRKGLEPRVRLRTEKMLQAGLIREVGGLLANGHAEWSPLQSVGYKEVLSFLKGEIADEESLKALIVQNTLRLAKKQRTWFQRDSEIQWLSPQDVSVAQGLVANFLN